MNQRTKQQIRRYRGRAIIFRASSRRRHWRLTTLLFLTCWLSSYYVCAQDWIYTVRPGDNLWDLTEKHLTHIRYLKKLQKLNAIEDPWHMLPGTRLKIPLRWVRLEPATARVVAVLGSTTVLRATGGQPVDVNKGMQLRMGDRLLTAPEASATVEFGDGSRMLIEPDSEVYFDMLRAYGASGFVDTRVRLKNGRTEHKVTPRSGPNSPRYEIFTPAATTAVRGTHYRIGTFEAGESVATEVLDGRVGVTAAEKLRLVKEGFGVVTQKGRPPAKPARLLEAPNLKDLQIEFERLPLRLELPVIENASAYRIQIADTERFDILRYDTLTDKPHVRGVDLPDGNYVLRMRGVDDSGLEGLDGYHKFVVDARPEPPVLLEPPEGALISRDSWVLEWAEPEGAASYHLQVAISPAFTQLLIEAEDIQENRFVLGEGLDPGIYYWRVATRERSGEKGPFGDPQSFKRLAAAPATEPPSIAEDRVVFRWSAGLPGDSFEFQLARDRKFDQIVEEIVVTEPTHSIDRPESGIYYLRVRTLDADGDAGPYTKPQRLKIPVESYLPYVITGLLFLIVL